MHLQTHSAAATWKPEVRFHHRLVPWGEDCPLLRLLNQMVLNTFTNSFLFRFFFFFCFAKVCHHWFTSCNIWRVLYSGALLKLSSGDRILLNKWLIVCPTRVQSCKWPSLFVQIALYVWEEGNGPKLTAVSEFCSQMRDNCATSFTSYLPDCVCFWSAFLPVFTVFTYVYVVTFFIAGASF